MHVIARGAGQQRAEFRPARAGGGRIGRGHEHAGELHDVVGVAEVIGAPDGIRGVVLDELDSAFGHFLRCRTYNVKFRGALLSGFPLKIYNGQRAEPMIRQTAMLAFGIRSPKTAQVHAGVALHGGAQALRVRRIHGRREEFQVAVLQHHADVRGAGRPVLRPLRRFGRHREAERLQRARGRTQLRHEVRDVIEDQAARDGDLLRCAHVALI